MIWLLVAGLLAGFAVGFIGAGAAVIGLPFLLYLDKMPPNSALGTNALGVAFTIIVICLYRIYKKEVFLKSALVFTVPGLAGVFTGSMLNQFFPVKEIIFILGFLLFIVAGWMYYLSVNMSKAKNSCDKPGFNGPIKNRLPRIGIGGFCVGIACGFFSIGGGFMIIPAIMISGDFPLFDAIATGLLPFGLFSLWIGGHYWINDYAKLLPAVYITITGLIGGLGGIWLSRHLSRKTMQRLFAVFMLGLGIYMIIK